MRPARARAIPRGLSPDLAACRSDALLRGRPLRSRPVAAKRCFTAAPSVDTPCKEATRMRYPFAPALAALTVSTLALAQPPARPENAVAATVNGVEIPRDDYVALLSAPLGDSAAGLATGEPCVDGDFFALDALPDPPPPPGAGTVSGPVSRKVIAQLLGHTS